MMDRSHLRLAAYATLVFVIGTVAAVEMSTRSFFSSALIVSRGIVSQAPGIEVPAGTVPMRSNLPVLYPTRLQWSFTPGYFVLREGLGLQLSTSSTFNPTISTLPTTSNSFIISYVPGSGILPLQPNTVYYWKVRDTSHPAFAARVMAFLTPPTPSPILSVRIQNPATDFQTLNTPQVPVTLAISNSQGNKIKIAIDGVPQPLLDDTASSYTTPPLSNGTHHITVELVAGDGTEIQPSTLTAMRIVIIQSRPCEWGGQHPASGTWKLPAPNNDPRFLCQNGVWLVGPGMYGAPISTIQQDRRDASFQWQQVSTCTPFSGWYLNSQKQWVKGDVAPDCAGTADVPITGLVAKYPFDPDVSPKVKSAVTSPSTLDGTEVNTGVVDGVKGKALSFDGVRSRVVIPDAQPFRLTGDLTFSACVKAKPYQSFMTGGFREYGILGKNTISPVSIAPFEFGLSGIDSNVHPELIIGNGQFTKQFLGMAAPTPNEWHYLAVTKKGDTVTHYLDGLPNGSGTLTIGSDQNTTVVNARDGGGPLVIGSAFDNTAQSFNGSIDEVKMYNRALTPQEIITDLQNSNYCAYFSQRGLPNPTIPSTLLYNCFTVRSVPIPGEFTETLSKQWCSSQGLVGGVVSRGNSCRTIDNPTDPGSLAIDWRGQLLFVRGGEMSNATFVPVPVDGSADSPVEGPIPSDPPSTALQGITLLSVEPNTRLCQTYLKTQIVLPAPTPLPRGQIIFPSCSTGGVCNGGNESTCPTGRLPGVCTACTPTAICPAGTTALQKSHFTDGSCCATPE